MKNSTLRFSLIGIFAITTFAAQAQNVAINTSGTSASASAILDLSNTGSMAFLAPQVVLTSTTVLAPVPNPGPAGLLVYNTSTSTSNGLSGAGYYYWTGPTGTPANTWLYVFNSGATLSTAWLITGNNNIVDGTNFLGTTTDVPLTLKVDGSKAGRIEDNTGTNSGANTFLGYLAGNVNTAAANQANTAIGYQAMKSNTTSQQSVAIGSNALSNVTSGSNLNTAVGFNAMPGAAVALFGNTAIGAQALYGVNNASGSNNTAVGMSAMFHTTTGGSNTMIGEQSGENNTTGGNNTALGINTMFSNVAGNSGTAIGYYAMYYANSQAVAFNNTNVAVGYQALEGSATAANNTGLNNTALGYNSMAANVSANDNTGLGYNTLTANTYAKQNVAVGSGALQTQSFINASTPWATDNTAVGFNALKVNQPTLATNGYQNTAIGSQALVANTTGSTNTAIGYTALNLNNSGSGNTAIGYNALTTNTTGTDNTALGYGANVASAALTNAGAIGYNASVSISNAIVLGQTATPTYVGIGTTSPANLLHVNGIAQVGTVSSKQGSLLFANTSANSVTLVSPNTTAATYTMTLPTNVAAATNYVLASTGANATLQWINPATTFSSTITANNGAYMSTASNVQFGTNPLIQNTTLPLSTYNLIETANQPGPPLLNFAHQVNNSNSAGTALAGINSAGYASGGTGIGLYGQSSQPNGYAIYGTNAGGVGIYGTGSTYGVEGVAPSSVGVYGSGNTGTEGNGTSYGIYGIGPVAVYGDANNSNGSAGGYFSNNTGHCFIYTAYYNGTNYFGVYSDSSIYTLTNVNASGNINAAGNMNATGNINGLGNLTVSGNFTAGGTKATLVEDKEGNMRSMFCNESPEVLFQDYGTSSLVNGKVHIDLDPIYASNVTINEKHPLRVIITMNDECPNNVYVTNRTATGFDVVEMNHGTSGASFTYEVIANRAEKKLKAGEPGNNYADLRFPKFNYEKVQSVPLIKAAPPTASPNVK